MSAARARHVVLAGAGHAHLYTLARAARLLARGHQLTVIGPQPFWYSGLATGMLGGSCAPEADQVSVARLLGEGDVRLLDAAVAAIDTGRRRLVVSDGTEVGYDILSLNVGSETAPLPGEPREERVYAVKPIANLWRLRQTLESALAVRATPVPRVLVAGAGPTGCELAANLAALARRRGGSIEVQLIGARLLPQLSPRAAGTARRVLESRGVELSLGRRVAAVDDGTAQLDDGTALPFDALVNATGLKPASLIRASGLPVDDRGALRVDSRLRSVADPNVLGGGDCIAIDGAPLPRVGVYAIRAAPVLYRNILATAEGRPLEPFIPQRRYLWIMNFGDRTALAARGRWWWHGRTAFWLKDWLDRRFLASYRR